MSAHTPGPWVYKSNQGTLRQASTGDFIAQLEQPSEADARLIETVPELATALRCLIDDCCAEFEDQGWVVSFVPSKEVIARARAALAKAGL